MISIIRFAMEVSYTNQLYRDESENSTPTKTFFTESQLGKKKLYFNVTNSFKRIKQYFVPVEKSILK